jgi:hypothetical protein
MAIDAIKVNKTLQLANDLVIAANQLAALQAMVGRIKLQLSHMNDGSNYATVETNTGATAGQGTTIVSLFNIFDAIVNGATGAGGATQQTQLLDVVGKLAGQ